MVQLTNNPRQSTESVRCTRLIRCDHAVSRVDMGAPGEVLMHRSSGGALVLAASDEPVTLPLRALGLIDSGVHLCPYN